MPTEHPQPHAPHIGPREPGTASALTTDLDHPAAVGSDPRRRRSDGHTRPHPRITETTTAVLSRLTATGDSLRTRLPGGALYVRRRTSSDRHGYVDSCAVWSDGREERAALIRTAGLGPHVLGPLVAAVIDQAPSLGGQRTSDKQAVGLDAESLHTVSWMRRDNRSPARLADGARRWSIPGAEIVLERWSVIITTPVGYARITFDGQEWDVWRVAAVLDAGLWWGAAPEARHMTVTTGDNTFGSNTGSVARCSCGWTSRCDDRTIARFAARNHRTAVGTASGHPHRPGHGEAESR